MKSFESIAQAMYEAFGAHNDRFGFPIKCWDELPERTRDAWIAAARVAADLIHQVH